MAAFSIFVCSFDNRIWLWKGYVGGVLSVSALTVLSDWVWCVGHGSFVWLALFWFIGVFSGFGIMIGSVVWGFRLGRVLILVPDPGLMQGRSAYGFAVFGAFILGSFCFDVSLDRVPGDSFSLGSRSQVLWVWGLGFERLGFCSLCWLVSFGWLCRQMNLRV